MSWPNRTLCEVLEEMRTCDLTKNYSYLKGLIEEVQSMGNRMESALEDFKDVKRSHEQKSDAEKELKEIMRKIEVAGKQLDKVTQ